MVQHTNPRAGVKIGQRVNFVKVSGNRVLTHGESGTHFTNLDVTGALCLFTLPALLAGVEYWIHSAVLARDCLLSSPGNDTMVVFNDIAADQIAFNTADERAGGTWHVTCDGTLWYVSEMMHEAVTSVIAS